MSAVAVNTMWANTWPMVLLASNLLLSSVYSGLNNQKLMVKLDRVELCYFNEDSPGVITEFFVKYTRANGYTLNVEAEIYRDWNSEKLWGYFEVVRCASREALDTCEQFAVLKPPVTLCKFLEVRGMGIGEFIEEFTPPARCPVKKGKIVGKDVVFNPDLFTMFPITGYYWKLYGYLGEGDQLWHKTCTEVSIVSTRSVLARDYNISMS